MRPHKLTLLVIFLIFGAQFTSGFGYLENNGYRAVEAGDEVHFKLYLFGTNESVKVMNVNKPENWGVNIDPDIVNFPVTENFRYIEAGDGYRKVVPFTISVLIPEDTESDKQNIEVFLTSMPTNADANGTGVTVRQIQDFQFTLDVTNPQKSEKEPQKTQKRGKKSTDRDSQDTQKTGGMTVKMPEISQNEAVSTPEGKVTKATWKKPVVLIVLFEIMWGIVLLYVLKRKY